MLAACSKVDYQLDTPDADRGAGRRHDPTSDAAVTADGGTDTVTPEAAPPTCDLSKPFNPGVEVAGLDQDFIGLSLTPDELTAYMQGNSSFDPSSTDLYVATRQARTDAFSMPVPLTALNTPDSSENNVSVTPDGNTLYFSRDFYTDAVYRATKTYTSTRANGTWSAPTEIGGLDGQVFLGQDHLPSQHVYESIHTQGAGVYGLQFLTTWGAAPTPISELNSGEADVGPALPNDELTMYFSSNRDGTDATDFSNSDIYVATRPSATSAFSAPTKVTELSTGDFEQTDWVSPDGCHLYFTRRGRARGQPRARRGEAGGALRARGEPRCKVPAGTPTNDERDDRTPCTVSRLSRGFAPVAAAAA